MAKKDDITLIIAKCFSKQKLTVEEKEICKDLNIIKLMSEYGLNDIQAKEVIKWCCMHYNIGFLYGVENEG